MYHNTVITPHIERKAIVIMSQTIVALDAMGGDLAPEQTVLGAIEAVNADPDIFVKLLGQREAIEKELAKTPFNKDQIEIVDASEVIETCESPVLAVRKKKESSMVKGLYLLKNGQADAFVSLGNTGALLVGGRIIVGTVKGIERPALAFLVPSLKNPVMIIDAGANVDARPSMLVQFAQMGSVYYENVLKVKAPRVGIVNIGEEEEKGNALVKEAFPLLQNCADINFTGSVESRGMTEGEVEVAVCDAFVGNTILKTYEGVCAAMISMLKGMLKDGSLKTKIGGFLIQDDLKKMLKTFSVEEYGGAPMLGLKGLVVKTHGNSKAAEVKNTIIQCKEFRENDVVGKIEEIGRKRSGD